MSNELSIYLNEVDVEAGMSHPAETTISHLLLNDPEAIIEFYKDNKDFDYIIERFIWLLGRCDFNEVSFAIVKDNINNRYSFIQESCIRAIEQWRNKESYELLQTMECSVQYIREYKFDILNELRHELQK